MMLLLLLMLMMLLFLLSFKHVHLKPLVCARFVPTPVGEVHLLVHTLEDADCIGVSAVPNGQIHRQQQRVDVLDFRAKGEDGDFAQWKMENTRCLGEQLY